MWIHLRKELLPSKRKSKLMPRANGPFEVLEKTNDNAYMVNFTTKKAGIYRPLFIDIKTLIRVVKNSIDALQKGREI